MRSAQMLEAPIRPLTHIVRTRSPHPPAAAVPRGLTLLEVVVAAALGAVVAGLVGALLVVSLGTWRRGRDLQEAQAHAAVLVDSVARDVRNASQTPGVVLDPPLSIDGGRPVLGVTPVVGPDAHAGWIVYVFREDRGEVVRQVLAPDAQGHLVPRATRAVATGVTTFGVQVADGGVTVTVEVRRGQARGRAQTTVGPRNP
jgi:prepilin-type N-terminal cleavage/methylation domain-containing protein